MMIKPQTNNRDVNLILPSCGPFDGLFSFFCTITTYYILCVHRVPNLLSVHFAKICYFNAIKYRITTAEFVIGIPRLHPEIAVSHEHPVTSRGTHITTRYLTTSQDTHNPKIVSRDCIPRLLHHEISISTGVSHKHIVTS